MAVITPEDRIIGCIVGGALGDALGGPHEGQAAPVDFELPPIMRISDDTQLTLATCEAVTMSGGAEPAAIADRLLHWFRQRRISGLGSSTLKALRDLDVGAHWALSGARGERAAGNGAAMRAAPLAFVLDPANDGDRRQLRDVCRITHHHDEAYLGALAIVLAIRHVAFDGGHLDQVLPQAVYQRLPDSRVRDQLGTLIDTADFGTLLELAARHGSSGFVAETVPLAILAAATGTGTDLLNTLREVVKCGGDTDTLASMTGQIIGAACGQAVLPNQLLDALEQRMEILEVACHFAEQVTAFDN